MTKKEFVLEKKESMILRLLSCYEEKKARKVLSIVGVDSVKDLFNASDEQLKCIASEAEMFISKEKEKLEENHDYCEAKDTVKLLQSGFRDATKTYVHKKNLCMSILKQRERG